MDENPNCVLTTILINTTMKAILICIRAPMNTLPKPVEPHPSAATPPVRPRIDSEKLLGGAPAVEIDHAGQRYLLRVTRENKLILTK